MASEITLYDLPTRDTPKCWSLNPWKTRLVLNYKNIPYKTEWIEYPDIAEHHKSIPPSVDPKGIAAYTIPAVQLPNGNYLMDSFPITQELERLYPSPSLHLDSPYLERVVAILPRAQSPLAPVYVPSNHPLLPPRSQEYYRRTRELRWGVTLEEFAKGGDAGWAAAEPALKEIAALLKENASGPFVLGKEVSYADFVIVSFMKMFDRFGQVDGFFKVDREAFGGLWEASQEWLKRDDH